MKMRNTHYIYIGMLAAILLAACSKDDGDSPQTALGEEGRSEIRVNTDVSKMLTRAAIIDDNGDLQGCDLKIDAYFHGENTAYLDGVKLHYDSSLPAAWKFWSGSPGSQTHYYWPIEGSVYDPSSANITVSSLDFVGYCPYAAPGYITPGVYDHSTGTSFSCDLSDYMTNTEQASMDEYLIAVLPNQTYADQIAHSGVPLQFKHPFALVKFVIAEGSGTHVQVNSISIAGLKTSGTCTYNGSTMTWSGQSGSTDMSQTGLDLKYDTSSTETTPFMVIPYNYGTKTLTVNGTWDDWSDVTKDLSTDISINWEPGCIYTYNLTVTPYALKVDVNKFTEQW